MPAYQQLRDELRAGKGDRLPLAVYEAARPYLMARLAEDLGGVVVVLAGRSERARQLYDELAAWLPLREGRSQLHLLADPDSLPYERIPWSRETRQARLSALAAVAQGAASDRPLIVVASARSLMQKTLPPRELRLALHSLRLGQLINLNELLHRWLGLGYRSDAVVEEVGQFSRRGGIVDIWPPNMTWPVRIELFGDEIESLRLFDPSTQRTLPEARRVQQVLIGPASEALPRVAAAAADRLKALDLSPLHPPARHDFEAELAQLLVGTGFKGQEWYVPYLYSQPASLLDYLGPTDLVLVDDGADLMVHVTELESQARQTQRDLTVGGELPANTQPSHWSWEELKPALTARRYLLLGHGDLEGRPVPAASPLSRHFVPGPRFGGQVRQIVAEVGKLHSQGQAVVMVTRQAPRLAELFLEEAGQAIAVTEHVTDPVAARDLRLVRGTLEEGWVLRDVRLEQPTAVEEAAAGRDGRRHALALFTDAELFGWAKPRQRRAPRPRAAAPEAFFADVAPGDYVVHMEHGIGRFAGLVKLTTESGVEREYLQVDYAQGDRLYVPVHQADRLSRYVGAGEGGAPPILHRLGTADWGLVKKRAQKAVEDIAEELLELYAARELTPGHAFAPDSAWQAELEAAFPYEETPDQLVAIEAVKHDMEEPRPMDRLICGDVGYGKTEVALRAAFKAVMDGKQVAILVPTTVLAQQHYQTFSKRLAPFPVTVEMLSRFRTPAQQREVVEGLAAGRIDIVIGTHRLLSKDVRFKDLGLLVVDEEQRFGVVHKERIKQMRQQVDVLTLTATPIPRTLHMSLTGVRDLSTIETPPEERLPIKTTIAEYDETLIRQAILREIDRDGQVFFVHNRVQGIAQIARRLERLVPEATFAIAHGQMPERELEEVMLRFANGEFDVLVCTTIIESGLDIPNANTIIINRADKFGLAQLYQLRGRVGRGAVRAYAYLLYDRHQPLSPVARERLAALQEASELGAGFRIAMRDLEIRGAGELLGTRQHGHISAVGFDLYCRLLAKTVQELRARQATAQPSAPQAVDGETAAKARPPSVRQREASSPRRNGAGRSVGYDDPLAPAVTLDLPLLAVIPEEYVPDSSLRLRLYRRIASVTDTASLEALAAELADRFGPLPEEVSNLLYQVRVKVLATRAGVTSIGRDGDQLVIRSERLEQVDRQRLQARLGAIARVGRRAIWMPLGDLSEGEWRARLERILLEMA
ncbi:MAG: transcription-repair coupling factor [Caldilineales bacterium]|nr:transcription-repair coupling factor [Caldilineales bacterium]MDW8318491.1 transcription-repair coupling factor [Anaerolineae bacterium]